MLQCGLKRSAAQWMGVIVVLWSQLMSERTNSNWWVLEKSAETMPAYRFGTRAVITRQEPVCCNMVCVRLLASSRYSTMDCFSCRVMQLKQLHVLSCLTSQE